MRADAPVVKNSDLFTRVGVFSVGGVVAWVLRKEAGFFVHSVAKGFVLRVAAAAKVYFFFRLELFSA